MGDKILKNTHKIFLFLTLMAIVYFLTFKICIPDYDLWARLAVGSLFFQTGGVLKHDIFSYSVRKPFWIDHEWGSGVVFYSAFRTLGEWGFFALKALLIVAIFILIIKIVETIKLNKNDELRIEPFYLISLAYAMYPSIASTIRSQIFTFVLFTLWIYLLEKVRRGENKLIWIFPVTMIFWANMHGGFVTGLGLLGIYALGELLNRKNPTKYFVIIGLSLLATLINPYGLKYWNYIIEATTMNRIGFAEWQHISLSGPMHTIMGLKLHILLVFFIFAFMSLVVIAKTFITRQKPDWVKILIFAVLLFYSIKHQRHTTFFVIATASLFYQDYSNIIKSLALLIRDKVNEQLYNFTLITKNVAVYSLVVYTIIAILPGLGTKLMVHPSIYPVGSLEFIKQNKLSGNLGVTYNWGSYALWKLFPHNLVLIDGRYEEVYPNKMYITSLIYSEHLNQNWHKFLDVFHTDILILPKSVYSRNDVLQLKSWKLVYQDLVSVVLLPKNRVRDTYIYPNFKNQVYWLEDYAKQVDL